jgi:hypothetical protein
MRTMRSKRLTKNRKVKRSADSAWVSAESAPSDLLDPLDRSDPSDHGGNFCLYNSILILSVCRFPYVRIKVAVCAANTGFISSQSWFV